MNIFSISRMQEYWNCLLCCNSAWITRASSNLFMTPLIEIMAIKVHPKSKRPRSLMPYYVAFRNESIRLIRIYILRART